MTHHIDDSRVRASYVAMCLACAAGCGDAQPRYGEVRLTPDGPRVTLTGQTGGQNAALELAPGCPGYIDLETPGHRLHVANGLPFTITASSSDGPLALAIAQGDEVRCDSDQGSGHAPHLAYEQPGEYLVWVASLQEPAELTYELTIVGERPRPPQAEPPPAQAQNISVTITSSPSGATVRDAAGAELGTTPHMYVMEVPADQMNGERTWRLELAGHRPQTVTGRLVGAAIVLHGQLQVAEPTRVEVVAEGPQQIRDYQMVELAVEVAESCPIVTAEVEFDIRHSFIGDLRVLLVGPNSEEISLHRHGGGGRMNLRRTLRTGERGGPIDSLIGHSTNGRWALQVHDDAGADTGTLNRFAVRFTCGPPAGGSGGLLRDPPGAVPVRGVF